MEGNIKSYLQAVAPDLPLEIVSQELYGKLNKLTDFFKDFAASEYILETSLNSNSAEADFSFRVLTEEKDSLLKGLKNKDFMNLTKDESWRRFVDFVNYWPQEIADLWLEMDYGEWEKEIPRPCFFFNAGQLKKNGEIDYNLLFTALKQLLGCEQVEELKENIKDVIQKLPAEVNLFQIGTMLSRNKDRVRIFTAELTREQVVEYLADLGWSGSFSDLDEILHFLEEFSDHQYILDFDVSRQGISERIGLNFGLQDKKMLSVFLESLASRQLCTEAKKQGVLAWSGSKGSFLGLIMALQP
ncbi:MAG TPA: hypothetical protein GXX38_02105 [Clostridia bacterium]|nr:hypothetical protein [Clostridia bacterium]